MTPLMGRMMQMPLLISSLVAPRGAALRRHRDRLASASKATSTAPPGHKSNSARSRLAQAFARLGCSAGDRVATLAWNGYRHVEIYYGASGSQLVCHTINPRLFPEQIAWIANDAADKVLCFDLTFAAAGRKAGAAAADGQALRGDDRPRAHAGADARSRTCCATMNCSTPRDGDYDVARVRREHRVEHLLHVGHDRQPEGRGLQPPLDRAARLRRGAARRDVDVGEGRRCCRWCRCSTSTPGAFRTPRRWSAASW